MPTIHTVSASESQKSKLGKRNTKTFGANGRRFLCLLKLHLREPQLFSVKFSATIALQVYVSYPAQPEPNLTQPSSARKKIARHFVMTRYLRAPFLLH